ncbi:MAG: pirin family protein [Proteobacteria bacterium]|nr:pirin family protein [Pseudomonadota bacterium]
MKHVLAVYPAPQSHWVGNGFPVRSLFSYSNHGRHLSPFLLLDYAGPKDFSPADRPRGVGEHPHRGFETVTIVYQGEVAHRDSTGKGGVIGPGDVQWMTAGAGILHEEFHSPSFTQKGGMLEMVQLWVNLPAKDKNTPPTYQAIQSQNIPNIDLPGGAKLRLIAGDFEGQKGAAHTFTAMNVWELYLPQGVSSHLHLKAGWSGGLVILKGHLKINNSVAANQSELVILEKEGNEIFLEAEEDSLVLLLSGESIDEPLAGYGPFVMNSKEEINQAIDDFNSGKFGQIAPK